MHQLAAALAVPVPGVEVRDDLRGDATGRGRERDEAEPHRLHRHVAVLRARPGRLRLVGVDPGGGVVTAAVVAVGKETEGPRLRRSLRLKEPERDVDARLRLDAAAAPQVIPAVHGLLQPDNGPVGPGRGRDAIQAEPGLQRLPRRGAPKRESPGAIPVRREGTGSGVEDSLEVCGHGLRVRPGTPRDGAKEGSRREATGGQRAGQPATGPPAGARPGSTRPSCSGLRRRGWHKHEGRLSGTGGARRASRRQGP